MSAIVHGSYENGCLKVKKIILPQIETKFETIQNHGSQVLNIIQLRITMVLTQKFQIFTEKSFSWKKTIQKKKIIQSTSNNKNF